MSGWVVGGWCSSRQGEEVAGRGVQGGGGGVAGRGGSGCVGGGGVPPWVGRGKGGVACASPHAKPQGLQSGRVRAHRQHPLPACLPGHPPSKEPRCTWGGGTPKHMGWSMEQGIGIKCTDAKCCT